MRLILFLTVIAIGTDAVRHNGAYTQAAWREISAHAERLLADAETVARQVSRRSE